MLRSTVSSGEVQVRLSRRIGMLACAAALALLCVAGGPASALEEEVELGVRVEVVAENLAVPWAIDFAPDGRIFFTERAGDLRVMQNGRLLPEPAISLDTAGGEGGLLGLALDPNFGENHYIYLYQTYAGPFGGLFGATNKVTRYTESENKLHDEMVLLDGIPGAHVHDGGRIKFGPDGMLYITTGDAADRSLSQDPNSLAGKILRINPDSSIPVDNPFEGSPVFTLGHRNPQGIDWDPASLEMVSSEHGPSGEPVYPSFGHDEINLIIPGRNYGWPEIVGPATGEGLEEPLLHTGTETWAPSGLTFYDSDNVPEWEGMLFVATLRGGHLRMLDIEDGVLLSSTAMFEGTFGRIRDAAVGPDGDLYILTSNRDGRGLPALEDDRILRISPAHPAEGDTKYVGGVPSVREQLEAGTASGEIRCREGLELVVKAATGVPACVTPASAERLVAIGWAAPPEQQAGAAG